jgi:hypothetical protein
MTTEATSEEPDEVSLLAWFCTHLPRFTEAADRYGWSHRLRVAVTEIREGASVVEATGRHRLPVDVTGAADEQALISRGSMSALERLGIDPVEVTGPYVCPARAACSRRAGRDSRGREPRCGVAGRTMILGEG